MHATSRWLWMLPLCATLACASPGPRADGAAGSSNLETARTGYDAFARGDIPTVLSLMDPRIVWHEAESLPYGGVYHSPDEVLENVFMAIGEDWEGFSAVPQEYIVAEDHVVVLGEYAGTHRTSGRSFTAPFAHVWRFEDGRLVEFRQLTDTALWLEAIPGR